MMCAGISDVDLIGEPTLDELLMEPIVRLIMQRDGVVEDEMRGAIERVKSAYKLSETRH